MSPSNSESRKPWCHCWMPFLCYNDADGFTKPPTTPGLEIHILYGLGTVEVSHLLGRSPRGQPVGKSRIQTAADNRAKKPRAAHIGPKVPRNRLTQDSRWRARPRRTVQTTVSARRLLVSSPAPCSSSSSSPRHPPRRPVANKEVPHEPWVVHAAPDENGPQKNRWSGKRGAVWRKEGWLAWKFCMEES